MMQAVKTAWRKATTGHDYKTYAQACYNVFECNPEGQLIWQRCLEVLGASSFVAGQHDLTAHNEGKRALVREIQDAINWHKDNRNDTGPQVITERPRIEND